MSPATSIRGDHRPQPLVNAGHEVTATTRTAGKVEQLSRLGARSVVVVDGLVLLGRFVTGVVGCGEVPGVVGQ